MRHLAKAFHNLKIRSKLILSFFFIILIPTFVIGNLLMDKMTTVFTDKIYFINNSNCQQIYTNISNRLKDYIKLSGNFSNDVRFIDYFTHTYDYAADYLKVYRQIMQDFSRININNEQSAKLTVYTSNPTVLPNGDSIIRIDDNILQQDWYKAVDNGNGDVVFNPTAAGKDGKLYLTSGKVLNSFFDNKYKNVLILRIPETELYDLIKNESESKHIYLVDSNGFITTSTVRGLAGKTFSEVPELAQVLGANPEQGKIEDRGSNLSYVSDISLKNSRTSWKLAVIIPDKIFFSEIDHLKLYMLLISIAIGAVAALLFFALSYGLTIRLKKLVNNMSNIRQGNFDVFADYDEKDEIGELSHSFKEMILRIKNLISEVYLAELKIKDLDVKKKEAELNALQSQINPHFLFNTMQSVGMNLVKKGDFETSDIISEFASLLRESINWQPYYIPLSSELGIVSSYMRIQKFRHRDKLDFTIDVPADLLSVTLPKFTLQPIVENAIYHGIEKSENNGYLHIKAFVEGRIVKITVRDNGIGMNVEKLADLREQLEDDSYQSTSRSIGIHNVHRRLRLYYGNDYGIAIESAEGAGTSVTITIPDSRGDDKCV